MKRQNTKSKFLTLFLITCLVTQAFLFGTLTVKAQEPDTFYVTVEASELYRLRGETVNIITLTNSSSFLQQIIAPNGTLLYNQTRTSNMTFTVPSNTAYGTYTIKSIVEGNEASTWLTILDVSSWTLATLPYTRQHNNMNYTFFSNWTVKVQMYDEEMFIDLGKLREWTNQLGLDVTVLKNSMNFLVRFSKAPYFALDLTFSFIHCGCKIIVNGTQDQAREFTFSFDAERFKSWLDGIRADHLIFDWSDIPKQAYTYNPDARLLTVHIPKTFRVDPTIFEDGFESGNFSAWTSTFGTPTVQSTTKHHGTYAVYLNGNEGCSKTILTTAIGYIRAYYYYDTLPGTGGKTVNLLMLTNAAYSYYVTCRINNNVFDLYLNENGVTTTASSGITASADTWYCLEFLRDVTNDHAELWINAVSKTTIDATITNNATLAVCQAYGSGSPTIDIYADCVVVDDAYIGPEDTVNLTFVLGDRLTIFSSESTLKSLRSIQTQTLRPSTETTATKTLQFLMGSQPKFPVSTGYSATLVTTLTTTVGDLIRFPTTLTTLKGLTSILTNTARFFTFSSSLKSLQTIQTQTVRPSAETSVTKALQFLLFNQPSFPISTEYSSTLVTTLTTTVGDLIQFPTTLTATKTLQSVATSHLFFSLSSPMQKALTTTIFSPIPFPLSTTITILGPPVTQPPTPSYSMPLIFRVATSAVLDWIQHIEMLIYDQNVLADCTVTLQNPYTDKTVNATLTVQVIDQQNNITRQVYLEAQEKRLENFTLTFPAREFETRTYNVTATLEYRDPASGTAISERLSNAQVVVEGTYFTILVLIVVASVLALIVGLGVYLLRQKYLGWKKKPEVISDFEGAITFWLANAT